MYLNNFTVLIHFKKKKRKKEERELEEKSIPLAHINRKKEKKEKLNLCQRRLYEVISASLVSKVSVSSSIRPV